MQIGRSLTVVDAVKESIMVERYIYNGLVHMNHFVNHGIVEGAIWTVAWKIYGHAMYPFCIWMYV